MILTLANNKGGVAKTTTAVNLAAAQKRRALLVDADGQRSATLSLGIRDARRTLADVLYHGAAAADCIEATEAGIDLLPGHPRIAGWTGEADALQRALAPLQYDFIVIDSPPSLSPVVIASLVAADAYIVPVVPQYLALEGLAGFFRAVNGLQDQFPFGAMLGILLTVVDYRTRAAADVAQAIRGHFGRQVFRTEIRINTRLAEAPSYGQTIFQYDKNSTGAAAYTALAREVQQRSRAIQ